MNEKARRNRRIRTVKRNAFGVLWLCAFIVAAAWMPDCRAGRTIATATSPDGVYIAEIHANRLAGIRSVYIRRSSVPWNEFLLRGGSRVLGGMEQGARIEMEWLTRGTLRVTCRGCRYSKYPLQGDYYVSDVRIIYSVEE